MRPYKFLRFSICIRLGEIWIGSIVIVRRLRLCLFGQTVWARGILGPDMVHGLGMFSSGLL